MATVDVVIPLAALVGAPLCNQDPVGARSINRDAILMMLDLLAEDQIVLMPTTNSAYGSGEDDNFCNEESPLRPISQYAREKVEIETRKEKGCIDYAFSVELHNDNNIRITELWEDVQSLKNFFNLP